MSLHADATDVLTRWRPPDDAQAVLRRRYLAHLHERADGLWRECHPDHLTASTLLLSADRSRVLLTLHRKLRRWLQTGGHCERDDPTLAAAARREAVEESGIAGLTLDEVPVLLSHHEVPCGPLRPAHHLDVQYAAEVADGAVAVASHESADLRWFPVRALPPDTDDSVRALVHHALSRVRG
ncbi:MAG TPA: NUDIX domain-containing protein [Nocardioidaceae bacterium]|nr:NUDIX domain-containing protein [Nocardioidaceae bacterium]